MDFFNLVISNLVEIDTQVFLFLNSLHADWLDDAVKLYSGRAMWIPFYCFLAYMIYRYKGLKTAILAVLLAGAAVGLADFVCASMIRPFVGRLRPSCVDNPISDMVHLVRGYRSGRYSFPSCHAANTAALAAFISMVIRRRAVTLWLSAWVVTICYSRIYLGVHYPLDLIVGAMMGWLVAWLMFSRVYIPVLRSRVFRNQILPNLAMDRE